MTAHGSKGRLQKKQVEASLRRTSVANETPQSPELQDGAAVRRRESRTDAAEPKSISEDGATARKGPAAARRPSLAELIAAGKLGTPAQVVAETRRGRVTATIERDGAVSYGGNRYPSLSAAASAARAAAAPGKWTNKGGPATNGWVFWKLADPKTGKLITVNDFARQDR